MLQSDSDITGGLKEGLGFMCLPLSQKHESHESLIVSKFQNFFAPTSWNDSMGNQRTKTWGWIHQPVEQTIACFNMFPESGWVLGPADRQRWPGPVFSHMCWNNMKQPFFTWYNRKRFLEDHRNHPLPSILFRIFSTKVCKNHYCYSIFPLMLCLFHLLCFESLSDNRNPAQRLSCEFAQVWRSPRKSNWKIRSWTYYWPQQLFLLCPFPPKRCRHDGVQFFTKFCSMVLFLCCLWHRKATGQVENTGVQLIRQASAKTNDVAGDGTTLGCPEVVPLEVKLRSSWSAGHFNNAGFEWFCIRELPPNYY